MAHRCNVTAWSTCCPVYKLFALISKKWNIFILRLIGQWHSTFTEIKSGLNELNSATLTQRLDELVESWVVVKNIVSEKPRTIRYTLSKQWKELLASLEPLEKMSKKIFWK